MRAIKFRVWNPNANKFVAYSGVNEMPLHEAGALTLKVPVYEILQYTGLKDKSGVEIYEGDILRDPILGESEICEVGWIDGCFVTRCYDDEHGLQYDSLRKRGDLMEVIGNIHENPELLNQDTEVN